MCGRYTLIKLSQFLEHFPWIGSPAITPEPRFNIAPAQPVAVITNETPKPRLDYVRWGLVPGWAKDASISTGSKMINARSETLTSKPTFSRLLRRRRCLIPADGFYEWKRWPDGKGKTPYRFVLKSGNPFAFAGLWDHWQSPDGSELLTCTIITTSANSLVAPVHDRMPVILKDEFVQAWSAYAEKPAEEFLPMLQPYPAELMRAYPVSSQVNSPRKDGPQMIEESQQAFPVQPTLFPM
jgi:putative SOS response-associated peptidase YedK